MYPYTKHMQWVFLWVWFVDKLWVWHFCQLWVCFWVRFLFGGFLIKFMYEDKTAEENGSNYCPLQSCKVDTTSHC